jgi:hypothetical protein
MLGTACGADRLRLACGAMDDGQAGRWRSQQQFQIQAAPLTVEPSAGLMVDALRLSTLQNLRCCRVDKARRSVSWTRHVGRACRIHHGLHEPFKIGIAAVAANRSKTGARWVDDRDDSCGAWPTVG